MKEDDFRPDAGLSAGLAFANPTATAARATAHDHHRRWNHLQQCSQHGDEAWAWAWRRGRVGYGGSGGSATGGASSATGGSVTGSGNSTASVSNSGNAHVATTVMQGQQQGGLQQQAAWRGRRQRFQRPPAPAAATPWQPAPAA